MLLLFYLGQGDEPEFPPAFTYDGAAARPAWFVKEDWRIVSGGGLSYGSDVRRRRVRVGVRFPVLAEHRTTGDKVRVPDSWFQ